MNTSKRPFLFFTFLLLTTTAFAQYKPYPDSIKIEFPGHKSLIVVQLADYRSDRTLLSTVPSMLGTLGEQIKKSIRQDEQRLPHLVQVKHSQEGKTEGLIGHQRFVPTANSDKFEIVISEQPLRTSLTVKGNSTTELLPPGWEMKITGRRFIISVYAPDLASMEALSKLDLSPVVASLDKETENADVARKGMTARLIYNENVVSYTKVELAPIQDMIGFHAGAGVGLVRDKFYPELNFATALYFANRHNVLRHRLQLSYELKFFSQTTVEEKYSVLTNSFVNLSYARNFSTDRSRWFGLGVGYLVNSKGDIYKGKTMKFFLESDIGNSKINIVPEFYLTNDFKDFNFGLKLQYKF